MYKSPKIDIIPNINGDGENCDPQVNFVEDKKTRERREQIQRDFATADRIRRNTYEEFNWAGNEESLINYSREMFLRFNLTPPPPSGDPDDDWKSNHVQPMTRNKVMAVIAAVTSALMRPAIIAQNTDGEQDRKAARIMSECVTYANYHSGYDDTMLAAVQTMCTTPAILLHQGYAQVKRKVKEMQASGDYTVKEVLDEHLSGFQANIIPVDELYISNFYEEDIQKQDFLIWRKAISWDQAYTQSKDKKGFEKYVQSGNVMYADPITSNYHRQTDKFLEGNLVYKDIYYHRTRDLQLTYFNGWLDGNPDAPYHRADGPLMQKSKKYPIAKSGHERFHNNCFYYMPLSAKLAGVQDEFDVLSRAIVDGTLLSTLPPVNIIGAEEHERAEIKPASMNTFSRPDTRLEPMVLGQNLIAGLNLLQNQKRTADETSISPRGAGLSEKGEETLGEVQLLHQNTLTQLGLVGRMVAKLVREYGKLLVDSIGEHLTIGEIADIAGPKELPKLRYNKLIIPNIDKSNGNKTTIIDFNFTAPKNSEEEKEMSFKLLEDGLKKNQTIFSVNPETFRKLKYSVYVEPTLEDKTNSFSKRIFAYDRLKQSELIDQRSNLQHNLIEPLYPGESERFLKKAEQLQNERDMAENAAKRPVGRPPNPEMQPQSFPNLPNN